MLVCDTENLLLTASAVSLTYLLLVAAWRLWLSPLAPFPGPKIAALTLWYECYYDVFKPGGGMYIWKIEEMHQKYGPVIRINPYELHIIDEGFYDQIYASAPNKRDKYEWAVKAPDSGSATGFTIDHELHRLRRDALAPFFSKKKVLNSELDIKAKVEQLCQRLDQHVGSNSPVNLTVVSLALTMDILTEYSFGEEFGLLKEEGCNPKWRDTILSIVRSLSVVRHFQWFLRLVKILPEPLARVIAPDMSQMIEYKERVRQQVSEVLSYQGVYQKCSRGKRTVIEALRDNPALPPDQKTLDRLSDECSILLIAGSESPAKVLAILSYHLMVNPSKMRRLRDELASVLSADHHLPSQAELERLPYLDAIVHEGLRLHSGITARSARIAPHPVLYKQWTIPAHTPLSCQSPFIHFNPDIFPEPRAFKPERWLESSLEGKGIDQGLKRHFVPFGRGTRMCLGYHLGYAMLYFGIAALASRYDMKPYRTDSADVDLERDWTIPQPKSNSQGVQALIVRKLAD